MDQEDVHFAWLLMKARICDFPSLAFRLILWPEYVEALRAAGSDLLYRFTTAATYDLPKQITTRR